ncbi:MAG: hypothetical protein RSB04_10695 [Gordonibacter sp.]|uniref:hypothetical protein n=1 Tax=Gordonibacter sp. TaxID=1968902 RepID=UPI002FCB34B5
MTNRKAMYEAYIDGSLVARGTKEECAERVGVTAKTFKEYACPSKSRPNGRIRAVRLHPSVALIRKPLMTKKPDPRIGTGELLIAMKRRRDEMFGLNANAEWEL